MKTSQLFTMLAVLAFSAGAFAVDDAEALFNKNKCAACHKLDAKAVGPTLKAVAAKYAADKDAPAKLEKKVREGGSGVWGATPMPRTPAAVSDADIKAMVAWMLSHK